MEPIYLTGCAGYNPEMLQNNVEELFAALNLDRLVTPGGTAVIKPNLIMKSAPSAAIITHPQLVAAVGKHLQNLGARVVIAESPGGPYTPSVLKGIYQGCGYTEMAREHGFTLNLDCSHEPLRAPEGRRSKQFDIITPILHADLVVDIAKLKSHCMTGMSGAVKNMFGAVPGLMKPELHCRFPDKRHFSEMLVDLCSALKPQISIVDAVVAMEGNGPTGGHARFVGALLGGENPFAVDFVAAHLMAMEPGSIGMLQVAMDRGLCPRTMDDIMMLGEPVSQYCVPDFQQPESKTSDFIERLPRFLRPLAEAVAVPIPKIRKKICVGCGKCAESHPQQRR